MQFRYNKGVEVSFEGTFESNVSVTGKYHMDVIHQGSDHGAKVHLDNHEKDHSKDWSPDGTFTLVPTVA